MKVLPGVGPSASSRDVVVKTAAAEPIPASVIANPIIGEIRRFDGTTPPSGAWMLTRGQAMPVTQNPQLFSILRTSAGGDGKTTFNLPKPPMGYIIAISGAFPTNPATLAASGRHVTRHADSLGEGAIPVPARMPRERAGLAEERRNRPRGVSAAPARWTPVSAALEARMTETNRTGRERALDGLSAANRALVGGVTDAVVSGALSINDAIARVSEALSGSEATALLDVNDRMMAEYRPGWNGAAHPNATLEAARFLVSVAFTPDQLSTLRSRS